MSIVMRIKCTRKSLGASTLTNKNGKAWCLLCDRDLDTCIASLEIKGPLW